MATEDANLLILVLLVKVSKTCVLYLSNIVSQTVLYLQYAIHRHRPPSALRDDGLQPCAHTTPVLTVYTYPLVTVRIAGAADED